MKDQIAILYRIKEIDAVIKSSEELKKRSAEEMQTAETSYRKAETQHQVVQDHVASFEKQRRKRIDPGYRNRFQRENLSQSGYYGRSGAGLLLRP